MIGKFITYGKSGFTAKAKSYKVWLTDVKARLIYILVFSSLALVGCKTVQPTRTIIQNDTLIIRDSVFYNNIQKIYDSVYIQGDTVHHYHIKNVYIDKTKTSDTKEARNEKEKECSKCSDKLEKSDKWNSLFTWLNPLVLIVGLVFCLKRSN